MAQLKTSNRNIEKMEIAISDFLLGFEEIGMVIPFFLNPLTEDIFFDAVEAAFREIIDDDDFQEYSKEIAAFQYGLLIKETKKMKFS